MKRVEVLKQLIGGIVENVTMSAVLPDGNKIDMHVNIMLNLYEWMNEELPEASPARQVVEDPDEEKKPRQVGKARPKPYAKKLDDGKMLALRKAGWTYEKIADEMGCTDQTVINHIRRME